MNFSRARAYPASESKNTRPMVTTTVTNVELRNQRGKSADASSRKALTVQVWGIGLIALLVASSPVLNEVAIWIRNG